MKVLHNYTLSVCLALIGGFLINKPLLAANNKIDSLKQAVASSGDKEQVENLLLLAHAYLNQNMLDSAIKYADQSLVRATEINYKSGIAESHYKYYLIDFKKGDHTSASENLRIFIKIHEERNDQEKLGKGYYSYGFILGSLGKKDSSNYYIQKSLGINTKLKDTLRIGAAYNAIANNFLEQSALDSAAFYYLKGAQLAELSGRMNMLGPIYNNLGKTFSRMKNYDKARPYLELALEINKNNNDITNTYLTLMNLGNNYLWEDDPEKALEYYDQAAETIKPLGDVLSLGDLYNNYAAVYDLQGKTGLALDYYLKALDLYQKQQYPEGITMGLKNVGQTYTKLKKYDLAQEYLDSSLQISTETGIGQNRRLTLWALTENNRQAGNYKEALEYYDQYFVLYDSMLSVDKVKALNELETKYQKEKDRAKILDLEKENLSKTIQRNAILYTSIGILMLAAFLLLYFRQRARKDRIIAQQQIRQLEEEKKIMAAKLLLEGQEEERKRIARELHDGLGVLLSATKMQFSSLKLSLPENKDLFDRAIKLLEQASGDVRKISHNMMPGLLTKLGFYEAVEDLIDSLNDQQDLQAKCTIEGEPERLPENQEIMLYRVIQELVNNSIRHSGARHVTLKIRRTAEEMILNYEDDGVGFDPEKVMTGEKTSLGLKSIESRVHFLNGSIRLETGIGKGVRYFIEFPV